MSRNDQGERTMLQWRTSHWVVMSVDGITAIKAIVISNGFSCREQIKQNSKQRAVHLVEVLATDV